LLSDIEQDYSGDLLSLCVGDKEYNITYPNPHGYIIPIYIKIIHYIYIFLYLTIIFIYWHTRKSICTT